MSCAASFENDVHSIEEVLMRKVFGALPYALLGEALAESMATYAGHMENLGEEDGKESNECKKNTHNKDWMG